MTTLRRRTNHLMVGLPVGHPDLGLVPAYSVDTATTSVGATRHRAQPLVAFPPGRELCSKRDIKYLTLGGLVARRGKSPHHRGDRQDRVSHRACTRGSGK